MSEQEYEELEELFRRQAHILADMLEKNQKLRAGNEQLRALLARWLASTTDVSSSEAQETLEALNDHRA